MASADTQPPSRVVWLASYPRSGSTWARFLLTAYAERSEPSPADVDRRVPDLHGRRDLAGDLLRRHWLAVKTHRLCTASHPWIAETERVIYLVRHPWAVIRSSFALLRALERPVDDEERYARAFLRQRGDPDFRGAGFGTWPTHVQSWTEAPRFPTLVVRYEDLIADTPASLTRIIQFLQLDLDRNAIINAVQASRIERMRELELIEKQSSVSHERVFHGTHRALVRGHSFVRTAAPNSPGRHAAAVNAAFGDTLTALGYSLGAAPPSPRELR